MIWENKRKLLGKVFLKEKKGIFVEILKRRGGAFSMLIYRETGCWCIFLLFIFNLVKTVPLVISDWSRACNCYSKFVK